jgi:trigger factor
MYAQAGQPLQRSEAQVRALIITLRREKALSRLVELATRPAEETEQQQGGESGEQARQSEEMQQSEATAAQAEATASEPEAGPTDEATSSSPATIVVEDAGAPADSGGQP